jgi:hypothetical protein
VHHPLIRLLLDANQVVVGIPVRTGVVVGFNRRIPVPDHHIQYGDSAAQSRQDG